MKLEHYFLYRDVDVDIKKVDKIEITRVVFITIEQPKLIRNIRV